MLIAAGKRGFDSFLAEQALEQALQAAVGDERQDAVQLIRGEESSWARVLDAARSRSLFSPRRAVVVRGAEGLKGEGEDVGGYLADPNPDATLVLLAAKVDRRRSVWKRLSDGAQLVNVEPPRGAELRARVAELVRARKLPLTVEGQQELVDLVGQDLRRLVGELDKLEAWGFGERSIGPDEVALVLGRGMARPVYELADAFQGRDTARTLRLLDDLLEGGEAPLRILAVLHRALRQLRLARALKATRASPDEVARGLGLPPNMAFKASSLLSWAGGWSDAKLRAGLQALDRADRRCKTGVDGRVALAAVAAEALGGPAVRPASRSR
ncbi:MAG: DNA polymerase III subunit delta [Vicinamibacteria bacterium]